MTKKMLMLISDGFEEIEALGTVDILRRCGVNAEICSVTGNREITSSRGIRVLSDSLFALGKINYEEWDGVILPGGQPNADNLRRHDGVVSAVKEFHRMGKLCCAICAAPIVLERAGLTCGLKLTSYPGCLEDENICNYTGKAVERDGNIITGKGPGVTGEFAFEICKALGLSERADDVHRAMMYKNH